MASFVYAVWSITNVASMHCSVRPEISPCTCEPYLDNTVDLSCERVESFHQIVDALSNKFSLNISTSLRISHSQLEDLEMRSFSEMNMNLKKLKLISNNLRSVPEVPFRGMSNIEYLSLAENDLDEIPKHVLNHLPKIGTLDLGRDRIKAINVDDFKGIPNLKNLIIASNQISRIDKNSLPKGMKTLHLGRNQIQSLNGTLRDLHELKILFINMNNITSLEDELPPASENLIMILARNNSIEKLPQSMKLLPNLETLLFENNKLRSFDGILKTNQHITRLSALNNQLEYLAEDEFQEAEIMDDLDLSFNFIKSLNRSLLPLKKLKFANFSFNELEEFSMNDIRGLEFLRALDVSHNKIERLTGRMENLIDPNSFLVDLNLGYNILKSLDGALMGLNKLRILCLSHNKIERILPDDFIGLESLEILDISHNQLLTLEETSTTFLPSLKILKAQFNNLTKLEKDFHGLPVLCQANLTNNYITSLSSELVSKTRCTNHGVAGKLEIWLEQNPIMCDERLPELCPIMLNQEARIRGYPHCNPDGIIPIEICEDPPVIIKPLPLLPQMIQTQIHKVSSPTIISQPSLVQVIVPAPLVISKPAALKQEIITTTTTVRTTTSTTSSQTHPIIEDESTVTTTPPPLSLPTTTTTTTTTPQTPSTTYSTVDGVYPPMIADRQQTASIEYSPIISAQMPQQQVSSEQDYNYVHENFSPIVLPPPSDNSQLLLIPAEPPENP